MAKDVIQGRTEDAQNPFLGADFWKEGTIINGFVRRLFQIPGQHGDCYELVVEGVEIDGNPEEVVNMGALKGFQMALQSTGYKLRENDFVSIECTSIKPPSAEKIAKAKEQGQKLSPMVYFKVQITPGRGESATAGF